MTDEIVRSKVISRMKNPLLAKRLEELLETTLLGATPGTSIFSLANEAIQRDPQLIDELMKERQLCYVCSLLRRKQRQMARQQRSRLRELGRYVEEPSQGWYDPKIEPTKPDAID